MRRQERHGLRHTPEYAVWVSMIQRCRNPKNNNYYKYGARGISVCDSWENSFSCFIVDMGRRPSANHSIDRINNSGNYEPSNCRWATRVQQDYNKRKQANNTSGYVGVSRHVCGKWHARLGRKHIGLYENIEDAVNAREKAKQEFCNQESEG